MEKSKLELITGRVRFICLKDFFIVGHTGQNWLENPRYAAVIREGQISATFGLVEFEDGTMHEVEPKDIRFLDGRIREYGFREGLDESENHV